MRSVQETICPDRCRWPTGRTPTILAAGSLAQILVLTELGDDLFGPEYDDGRLGHDVWMGGLGRAPLAEHPDGDDAGRDEIPQERATLRKDRDYL
jgi:hypothetical protein